MATQAEHDEDEDLSEVEEIEEVESETETEADASEPEEGEIEDYAFGDDDPEPDEEAAAPQWVRDVRKRNRELERELTELKRAKEPKTEELGPYPKESDGGIDFDEEVLQQRVDEWLVKRDRINAAKSEQTRAQEQREAAWSSKVNKFATDRQAVASRIPDYETREAKVAETLNADQHKLVVGGAKNAAAVFAALARNDSELQRVAAIKDNVEFAFELGRMEATLKTRKPETSPERIVKGGAPSEPANHEKKLAKLEAEAAKTGNRNAIIAFKRSLKPKEAR